MLLTTAAGELLTLPTGDLLVTEGGTPTDPDPTGGLGIQPLGTSPLGGTA